MSQKLEQMIPNVLKTFWLVTTSWYIVQIGNQRLNNRGTTEKGRGGEARQ